MDRLTPELWLHSQFAGNAAVAPGSRLNRELDFNLARRSAVVINRVVGQMQIYTDVTSGHEILGTLIQELDTDPDNVLTEFGGVNIANDVEVDSSRPFRQVQHLGIDTAAGAVTPRTTVLEKSWQALPMEQRPISITNLRHNVLAFEVISLVFRAELNVDYFIVELSLMELGILNATRR